MTTHSGRCCLWKGTHKGSKKDAAAVSTPLPVSKQTHFQKKKAVTAWAIRMACALKSRGIVCHWRNIFKAFQLCFLWTAPKWSEWLANGPCQLLFCWFLLCFVWHPQTSQFMYIIHTYTYVINYTHSANCARSISAVADYSRSDFKLRTRIWSQPSGGTLSKSAQSWVENLLSHSAGRATPILQLTLQEQLECPYTTVSSSSWCYWG